jgi:glucose-6-phosphate isomerase
MPPRRGQGVPIGAGRGRPVGNTAMQEEMRQLKARLEAMEAIQRRDPDAGDISEGETSEEEQDEVTKEERVLRMLVKVGGRPKVEVPMYEGNLNVEELMDWINTMDKYFDFEEVEDRKKVKYATTRLKGHATIWWDELQFIEREKVNPKLRIGIKW